jgi:xanthine dehydrogenase accessory factor
MRPWRRLAEMIACEGRAALVSVHEVKGSAPRAAGARMIVRPDGAFHGTIGGGQLEWRMLAAAREALADGRGAARFLDEALGPDLGQCCGGRVIVLVETFDERDADEIAALAAAEAQGTADVGCRIEDGRVRRSPQAPPGAAETGAGARARSASRDGGERAAGAWRETLSEALTPLLLFGAGHVGRALVLALAPLPFAVRWVDSRENAFPAHIPACAMPVHSPDPEREVARAPQDSLILVMTHSHPLDLAIVAPALAREFPYVGLIGSATKRARFAARLRAIGLPESRVRSLVCPIGLEGIRGKEPAVIAAATVAQLLQVRENGALVSRSRFH